MRWGFPGKTPEAKASHLLFPKTAPVGVLIKSFSISRFGNLEDKEKRSTHGLRSVPSGLLSSSSSLLLFLSPSQLRPAVLLSFPFWGHLDQSSISLLMQVGHYSSWGNREWSKSSEFHVCCILPLGELGCLTFPQARTHNPPLLTHTIPNTHSKQLVFQCSLGCVLVSFGRVGGGCFVLFGIFVAVVCSFLNQIFRACSKSIDF